MSETTDLNRPLDPKLKSWLKDEVERRLLPASYGAEIAKLVSWASTHRDGLALHDLLKRYERKGPKP